MEEITADPQQYAETRNEASGLLQCIERLETAILLELWNDILQQFQKTRCSLEKAGLPLNCALNLLDLLLKFVEPLRDKCDEYEKNGAAKCGHSEHADASRRSRKRNRRIIQFDEGPAEDTVFQPRDKFRVEVFFYSCRPHILKKQLLLHKTGFC